jgi:hypothetical protein
VGQAVRLCERLVAEAVECVKAAEGAAAHAPAVMIEVMTRAIFNPLPCIRTLRVQDGL